MKYFYFLLFASLLFTSCDKPKNTTKELEEVFSKEEIKDLNVLVDYFESKLNNDNLEKSYEDVVLAAANHDNTKFDINKFNIKELRGLYKKIDPSLFNQIWVFGGSSFNEKDTVRILNLRNDKKYVKFLKKVGLKNLRVNEYVEELLTYNEPGYMHKIFIDYDYNKKKINLIGDFNDYNNRVIITIHVLTKLDYWYITESLR